MDGDALDGGHDAGGCTPSCGDWCDGRSDGCGGGCGPTVGDFGDGCLACLGSYCYSALETCRLAAR